MSKDNPLWGAPRIHGLALCDELHQSETRASESKKCGAE